VRESLCNTIKFDGELLSAGRHQVDVVTQFMAEGNNLGYGKSAPGLDNPQRSSKDLRVLE
jgi:hypothetical protein